jgi:hypothetical protein
LSNEPVEDRRSSEVGRLWKAIHKLEVDGEKQDQERDQIEKQVSGLSYAVFGVSQVPNSGLVNEIPERFKDVDKKLDEIEEQVSGVTHAMWGFLTAGLLALGVQVLIHYT